VRRLIILFLAFGLLSAATTTTAQEAARLALLVGNKGYASKVGILQNPHNDVDLIEASLKKLGFKVTVLRDAGYKSMDSALKRYVDVLRRAGPGAISFFYYSGHGVANPETQINYLIPVDADIDETDANKIWYESFQQSAVIDLLRQAPNATHYVVFDACRNELNLSGSGAKSLGNLKGFVPIHDTTGLLIAYATAPKQTASDSGTGGGPYAKVLAEELIRPGVEAVTMFRNVQIRVKQTIGQDPWLSFPSLPAVYLAGHEGTQVLPIARPPPLQVSPADIAKICRELASMTSEAVVRSMVESFWGTPVSGCGEARLTELHAKPDEAATAKSKAEERLAILKTEIDREKTEADTRPRPEPQPAPGDAVTQLNIRYATNRGPLSEGDPAKLYGPVISGKLEYGTTVVTVPPTHTPGSIELPSLWKLELTTDPRKFFALKSVAPGKGTSEMFKTANSRSLLLFVHGYNTDFETAALRTAQLAHDLRLPGEAMFFGWPSAGQARSYYQDEETARLSEAMFAQLLMDLSEVDKVYVIAHAMGARIAGHAIQELVDKGKKLGFLRELVLIAPDVNADLFRAVIAPKLKAVQGLRTTIYASSSDLALRASKIVHGFKRVGETIDGPPVYPGIETIDASTAAPVALLKDVQSVIQNRSSAAQRGLIAVGVSPDLSWRLP
jgi:esterase/lipase superfamily enzyme